MNGPGASAFPPAAAGIGARPLGKWWSLLFVSAAFAFALFMGLVTAVLPWQVVVALVLFPVLVLVPVKAPLTGPLLALALIFEVLPDSFQPSLPLGGIQLRLYDMAVFQAFGLMLFGAITTNRPWWSPLRAFRWPLLYLFSAVTISLVYVRVAGLSGYVGAEVRNVLVWLLLPATVFAVRDRLGLSRFVGAVVFFALVVALYVTLQTALDIRILARIKASSLDSALNADVVRSIAGGAVYLIIFSLLLIANRVIERRAPLWFAVPAMLLLCSGLAVQFGRGVWVAGGIGLLLSAFLFRGVSSLVKVTIFMLVALVATYAGTIAVKPRVAEALYERVVGIQNEVERGGSFGFRKAENRAAINMIEKHPWMGVGAGGEYKQTTSAGVDFDIETSYIHNAYLYFPLKFGLWSSLIPFTFILAFIACYARYRKLRTAVSSDDALAAAACGAFVVPVITSYTQPEWVSPAGIAAYVVFMSIILILRNLAETSGPAGRSR